MADGMGDDGLPTIGQLKQLSWDISYIRDKLTLNDVSKCLVWRWDGAYQLILGRIVVTHYDLLSVIRLMAAKIAAGDDGPAPEVSDFGQSGFSYTQLMALYNHVGAISSKLRLGKRTFIMRMSASAGSNVELLLGNIESSSVSYRLALKYMAEAVESGQG